MKKEGASRSARLIRQEAVYRHHLQGRTINEISRQLGYSGRTIERDLQEINISFSQNVHASELLSLKMALARLDEVYREAWILYGQPPRKKPQRIGRTKIELTIRFDYLNENQFAVVSSHDGTRCQEK